jgi:hypothetical protein
MRPLRTFAVCATALAASSLPLVLSCAPGSPCHSADTRRQLDRFSHPYAGHWVITHGDSLTIPDPTLGDRFRITDLVLGTDTASIGTQCLYRGTMVFAVPKAETLTVSWFGVPEHVTVFGWPAELGPFAGVNAQWWGRDSLRGAILYDERMGVQARPGATAQFWAGRR